MPAEARQARVAPGSARSLLLTLLGEFLYPDDRPAWTAQLLHGLAGAGIEEKSGRQAIARAAAAGWIQSESAGRRVSWKLTAQGRGLIAEGSHRLRSLKSGGAEWGGEWLVLHISLPENRREDRLRTYRALNWLGFGNPTPGVWISPVAARAAEAKALVERFRLEKLALAFTARSLDFGLAPAELVSRAWDLEAIADHYADLADRFARLQPRTQDEVLFAHVRLVNALQRLPSIDPGLPSELLPAGWSRGRQLERLWALREKWRATAHERWESAFADLDREGVG